MENIGNKRRLSRWLCAWVCSLAVLCGSFCFAAEDEPTPGELLKKTGQLMKAKKYEEAIATMYAYLEITDISTAQGVIRIAQDLRFKLIVTLIEHTADDRLAEAAEVLQTYIDRPLAEHPRLARSMLATCFFETGKFDLSATAAKNALLFDKDPTTRAGAKAWTPDEEEMFSKFVPMDYELEYADEAVTALYMTIAESYYKLERWEECIEPYQYVAEHTLNSQHKGYSIMQMINAMVAMPDFDRIAEWIPVLYRTPARYDIRVNLALMDVAAALYDEGQFDEALPLYRMILPREELIAYQEARLRELRIEKELPPEEDMKVSDAEKDIFGIVDEPKAATGEEDAASGEGAVKPKEIRELEGLIQTVKNLPPYETDIKYRMAQIYDEVGRFWEAVKFLDIVYKEDPQSKMGEFSIHQIVKILLQKLDVLSEAEEHGFAFLEQQKTGLKARQVAYLFTNYHQKKDEMEAIKELRPYLDSFIRAGDDSSVTNGTEVYKAIVKYDAELYYMQAVADLVLFKFAESETGFKLVADEFPGSHQEGNALYWHGMTQLFQLKFTEAHAVFEDYAQRFPEGEWVDEVSYQGGVCLFGIAGNTQEPDYTAASNRFSHVIATYPNPNPDEPGFSSVFPDACSMRGDIYGSLGTSKGLEDAEMDYRTAIAHAKKPAQATYAVFQLAKIFKATDQYDKSIKIVEAYLDQWKEEADIAKALFWIGKSKLQKRALMEDEQMANALVDEVVDDYLAAIMEYGTDVKEEGVDLMIEELVRVSSLWLDFDKQEALLAELKASAEATDDLVLKLRLRVTMAMITKTETELGRQLLAELPDFESVSPPVLAAICKISIENKDFSRAEELLGIFETKFEDSDYMRMAYKLRSLGQFADEDYEDALETIEDAQSRYSGDPDMAWAQLMKAQLLLERGDFASAISNNLIVIGVPAWRGEPVVQATYQLGQVEEQAGVKGPIEERDKRVARGFAYYQRVYYQYKGYAKGYWAAEAYLASARCLDILGQETDRRNTFIALLYDPFVNTLPQADVARKELGPDKVAEIEAKMEAGAVTNIIITVEMDAPEAGTNETETVESEAPETEPVATGGDES